ncbi:MAG: hypothetical protein A3F18_03740 [Legionellales bacterium RIFCSPHIGHO2_12_FULL_37_14]|nr:MAG: hypothetical protein A3F18_03740 [Legionellales bacterium RIFCSPHIGHO2_12_FULL_37_14]
MANQGRPNIAIVGIGLKLPKDISSLDKLWRVLKNGENQITKMDESRFSARSYLHPRKTEAGKSYTFSAGVLAKIDEFDPEFFGISPREALQMDPQQRLLLETSWAALENARYNPKKLAGTNCAVFVGISGNEYSYNLVNDPANSDVYSMLGSSCSISANRISYFYDLHGPSMSVDTACSSSMVALHQACQSIWHKDSSMAMVGGVNLLLSPNPFIGFSKAAMLSPQGQCQSFAEMGDGYVRSEGCVVLLLKPLELALEDNDIIHALIVNTGVNSDGRTQGMALPSHKAQEELLKKVHKAANILPEDIDYVEAHGTGTAVGDYAETAALGAAIAQKRKAGNPLPIGSIKSNVGHLEPVSGLVGILKTILCLQHGEIPPSIQCEQLNSRIDFANLNLKVVKESLSLAKNKKLIMAVNSFGFGGTNAHVILAQHVTDSKPLRAEKLNVAQHALPPFVLSFHNKQALPLLAQQYVAKLEATPSCYYDLAYSLVEQRLFQRQHCLIYGKSVHEVLEILKQLAEDAEFGKSHIQVVDAESLGQDLGVALVYSGNGSQWQGMAALLLHEPGIFKDTIAEIDALFANHANFSLSEELFKAKEQSRFADTEIAQPCLFAVQVAITRYLLQKGLRIKAVTGHSVGEIAAAWASGILTLEQAVEVVYQRSFWQGKTRGQGRMMAVAVSEQVAKTLIADQNLQSLVCIAAINSINSVTLAGDQSSLEDLQSIWQKQNVFCQLLDLDYAFHSKHMNVIRNDLLNALAGLSPKASSLPFISTVFGKVVAGKKLDASYWWDNIRKPVKFQQAIEFLLSQNTNIFIEVGPHPILRFYLDEIISSKKHNALVIPTFKRNGSQINELIRTTYTAWLSGAQFDKTKIFPQEGLSLSLPPYPFIKSSYFIKPSSENFNLAILPIENPLLGRRIKLNEAIWENHLDPIVVPYLQDHVVDNAVVFPAAGFVEMALSAAHNWYGQTEHDLRNLDIVAPMVFDEKVSRLVRFELQPIEGYFEIKSKVRLKNDPWILHAMGQLLPKPVCQKPKVELNIINNNKGQAIAKDLLYKKAKELGLAYGLAFQGIIKMWVKADMLIAKVGFPLKIAKNVLEHRLYPGLLDACFQLLIGLLDKQDPNQAYALLPIRIGRLQLLQAATKAHYITAQIVKHSKQSVLVDFSILDEEGQQIALIKGGRFQQAYFYAAWREIKRYKCELKLLQPLASLALPSPQPSLSLQGLATGISKHFSAVMPLFDLLIGQFAYEAIKKLAGTMERFTLALFMRTTNIAQEQQLFLQWCCKLLCDDGFLQHFKDDDSYAFLPQDATNTASATWRMLLQHAPQYQRELLLAGLVGLYLKPLLQKEILPEEIISPQRLGYGCQDIFETATSSSINPIVLQLVANIVATVPSQQRIRVLDIGYGINHLSRELIHSLPNERTDYHLLVVDDKARISIEQYVFVDLHTIKASQSWEDLDVTLGANVGSAFFDIVLIRYTAHTFNDFTQCFKQCASWLKKDGVLLLVEQHKERFYEWIFGIEPAWWRQSELHEPVSRLSSPQVWTKRLTDLGFTVQKPFKEPGAELHEGAYLLFAKPSSRENGAITTIRKDFSKIVLFDGPKNFSAKGALSSCHQVALPWHEVIDPVNYFVEILRPLPNAIHIVCWFDELTTLEQSNTACMLLKHLIVALQQSCNNNYPTLTIITQEALLPSLAKNLNFNAILYGFCRVLMNEHSELACKLIDIQGKITKELLLNLEDELALDNEEREVVLKGVERYGFCVEFAQQKTSQLPNNDYYLDCKGARSLNNLCWLPKKRPILAADDVMVRPYACGLNFRDVMYAMNALPDEAVENGFLGASLGMEFAGEVIAVGESVSDFHVGAKVMGFAPASFSSLTVTKKSVILPLPDTWSYEAAATVPIAFFTAYYALNHLARLTPGESVLIHGAAGGVGLAAIQIAQHLGAKIYVTAGSSYKRDFLALAGVANCYDSRSISFADDILEDTKGEGVDVVLNCLAKEAIGANLDILKPFGRFLELGKRDFFANTKIGLRPFKNNISYFGIDADQLLLKYPQLCANLFKELMSLFTQSILTPLPYLTFDADSILDAFRLMQQSRHIGKVVVNLQEKPRSNIRALDSHQSLRLAKNATYLVTGGCNGFGLQTAKFLVAKGARHIVLVGRSGITTDEAQKTIDVLSKSCVSVKVIKLDISDALSVKQLIASLSLPLKGVIHAATVYEDTLIMNMTSKSIHNVLAPKVQGALNLHASTQGLALDFFIVYSSVTTLFGNPGQANYVAANTYLEHLILQRRAMGLKGLFVAWGPIADTGYLSRHAKLKDLIGNKMGQLLKANDALNHLAELIINDEPSAYLANFNFNSLERYIPVISTPKFSVMRNYAKRFADLSSEEPNEIRALIAEKSFSEASLFVVQLLIAEIAQILRLSEGKIARKASLMDLGMDSLVGAELSHAIKERFAIQIPMMSLSQGITIEGIAERIVTKIQEENASLPSFVNEAAKHGEVISQELMADINQELETLLSNNES